MYILGISAYYHDSAAALINENEILYAAQEERFTRIKHDASFPINSIKFCLKEQKISLRQVDYIVFYEKPFLKFERLLETYLSFAPKGFQSFKLAIPIWLKEKLFLKKTLIDNLKKICNDDNLVKKIKFSEHHLSHSASAFFPSPFESSAILTMDGVGEWTTTSMAFGNKNKLDIIKEIHFPDSIGLLYSAFTYFAGFKVNSGEYKLMGLAPYGSPKYKKLILDNLIDIKDDGSFRLDQSYFNYCVGLTMTSKKFNKLFNASPRKASEPLTEFQMDLAASIQSVIEEIVIKLAKNAKKELSVNNLCLSGGVALNCVANGILVKNKIFKNIWIQPASGDSGGALGAALAYIHLGLKLRRKIQKTDSMKNALLGPKYNQNEILKQLRSLNANFLTLKTDELIDKTSNALKKGKAVGWFQGRMEFGPRALGNRSILADPRSPKMQRELNLKIKFRESFRPFAPAILLEKVNDWFELSSESPYMLLVSKILSNKRVFVNNSKKAIGLKKLNFQYSKVPAITHVDYSARIQTVSKDTNPFFYKLTKSFYRKTRCPILVNTSFNVRGEPIVNSVEDAFNCFINTNIDVLVIGNCYLEKNQQNIKPNINYLNQFELD